MNNATQDDYLADSIKGNARYVYSVGLSITACPYVKGHMFYTSWRDTYLDCGGHDEDYDDGLG